MKRKWGIIGCGNISEQFATCLQLLENAELAAVASQTPGKAKRFSENHGSPKVYESYLDLVRDESVEIVYIGTTHNFHLEHTFLALDHGKHVLCEKPISLNAGMSEQIINKAREKNLFLMEAVWTRFLPATIRLKEMIQQGAIGDVHKVNADFSIFRPFDPTHRLYNRELGGGALLDLGIYPLTFAHLVFDDFPTQVQTTSVIGKSGIDETSSYLLEYSGGRSASLSSSCRTVSPHLGFVFGSEGYFSVPDFYHPQEFTLHKTDFVGLNWEQKEPQRFEFPYDSLGYGHEATEVMRCIDEGLIESPLMPLSISLKMMKLMDAMRSQWGLSYPGE